MTRVFSGIKPTGGMHLGNLVGAVQRWVAEQAPEGADLAAANDKIYFVADLHAMTVPWEPAELAERTRELAMLLMAAGLDPSRSLLFVQSHVGEIHGECTWILNCIATMGELLPPADRARNRMLHHPTDCRPCMHAECPIGHPCATMLTPDAVAQVAFAQLRRFAGTVYQVKAGAFHETLPPRTATKAVQ